MWIILKALKPTLTLLKTFKISYHLSAMLYFFQTRSYRSSQQRKQENSQKKGNISGLKKKTTSL